MRPPRAALEVRRNARAFQRVLEQTRVVLRSAHRDRHPVERRSRARLPQDSPRDFHGFPPFARRRKQFHGLQRLAGRSRAGREQVATHPVEPGCGHLGVLDCPERCERRLRCAVALRKRGQRRRRTPNQRADKRPFGRIRHGRVEQDEGARRVGAACSFGGARRGRKERRAIDGRDLVELRVEAREQFGKIGSALARTAERLARHGGKREFFERARQGAWKSGRVCDRSEVAQRSVGIGVVDRAGSDRLYSERGGRRQAVGGEQRRRKPGGKLRQAEPVQAEGRAPPSRDVAHEVVRRTACGADNEDFSGWWSLENESTGGVEPERRRRGPYNPHMPLPSGRRSGHPGQASARRPTRTIAQRNK